ncbi:LysM peptidoglycan-binding domain-containing protein [Neisseria sp. ZJ106]|uniref:LysM peptidoglycan-binding domain-containing protein n=1 Tax=Neisseria lisongii TaxID=2912188 RepID=A0ABY7RGT7_9NEIS|nr:LysM peptidoglycan-binding domain-containing protein [Neisseria lisongii]MCF7520792.1 LysM peptidoglycan-binding domain-containing protein [Neisseria lisongii]WCL70729.1 LysM peptidoglycan-binding domain-containing protein [Neisseria lisongii]
MTKLKTLVSVLSGLTVLSAAHVKAAPTPDQIGMAVMQLNASLLQQAKAQTFGSGSLWASLRQNFRIGEVNSELVRRHESKFTANRSYFDRTINRSKPYLFHIANEVKKRNMPAEIALLPFIESAFVTKAKSHVGASGLWQFMPATGRHYGLERTALYDGRHDVYAATDAALNYLQYLHGLFGDWSLALAAYNWGEGNVGRAVNRARAQGLEPTYENLRMPNETRNYVPKLLAVRNIVANPQSFGLNISDIVNRPYFQTVHLDKPIDQAAIARLANISESEFLALNPGFNAPVFIPKANRKLLLPTEAVATFERNYRNADPGGLLSWDIYTPFSNTSLSSIAAETGMSIAELKRLNGISSNTLSAGRSILVAKNSLSNPTPQNFIDIDNSPDTYQSDMPTMAAMPVKAAPATQINFVSRSEPATQTTDFVRQTASVEPVKAATVVQPPVITETVIAQTVAATQTAATNPDITTVTVVRNEPVQTVAETVITPTVAERPSENGEAVDPMMALVEDSTLRLNASESVKAAIVQAENAEAAAQARAAKLAENRAKTQKRTETKIARSNASPTPAGTHRVEEGDTLFNIAQRYNLSVADLIIANDIKGNNIRKGQLLNLTAAQSSGRIQNVSYIVRKGDTIDSVARRFNIDANDIRRLNKNAHTLSPGQQLKLTGS